MRRMIFGFNQVFLNSQVELQNSLNLLGTFFILLYILKYFNHKDKMILICEILGESAIFLTMCLSFIFLSNFTENVKEMVETSIMVIIISSIFSQVVVCLIITFFRFASKLISKKKSDAKNATQVNVSTSGFIVETTVVYPINSQKIN